MFVFIVSQNFRKIFNFVFCKIFLEFREILRNTKSKFGWIFCNFATRYQNLGTTLPKIDNFFRRLNFLNSAYMSHLIGGGRVTSDLCFLSPYILLTTLHHHPPPHSHTRPLPSILATPNPHKTPSPHTLTPPSSLPTPLIFHRTSTTTRHSPLINYPSSLTPHHLPIFTHPSSLTRHHSPLIA